MKACLTIFTTLNLLFAVFGTREIVPVAENLSVTQKRTNSPSADALDISTTAASQWYQFTYWSDDECTKFAATQGLLLNTCIASSGIAPSLGPYVYITYQLDTDLVAQYTLTYTYYSDSLCSTASIGDSFVTNNANCSQSSGNPYFTSATILPTVRTNFPGDGTLARLFYTAYCSTSFPVFYLYETYNTGFCFPSFKDVYSSGLNCGVYLYSTVGSSDCLNRPAEKIATDFCLEVNVFSTATQIKGYPQYTCYGSTANDDKHHNSEVVIIVCVVLSFVVLFFALTVGTLYHKRMYCFKNIPRTVDKSETGEFLINKVDEDDGMEDVI